jgi:hypothetical protein
MGLFIGSPDQAAFAGIFAVEISPPSVIEGVSQGYHALVGQFAWGPVQQLYTPENAQDFYDHFEPAGSPRSSSGYLAIKGRKRLSLKMVRALASDAVKATATIAGTGGNANYIAKYFGVLGISITITWRTAISGLASAKDCVITLTDPVTGTTTETIADILAPTGTLITEDVSKSKLLGSFTLDGAMTVLPANGTTSMSGGSNGAALGTADYVGTAGVGDKGISLFEQDGEVRVVSVDDCGNTHRAAIGAGIEAHVDLMGDRIGIADCNPDAADWATVKSEQSAFVDDRMLFCGHWGQIFDDAGILRTTPLSTFIGSARINLEIQQSHAWRNDKATDYYTALQGVVGNFSYASDVVKKDAFRLGIQLLMKTKKGRWAFQHDRNTNPDPTKRYTTRRVVTDYEAISLTIGLDPYVNGPNVITEGKEMKAVVDNFLDREIQKGHIAAESVDISMNTTTTMGLGDWTMGVAFDTISPRERTFLLINGSPNAVSVSG